MRDIPSGVSWRREWSRLRHTARRVRSLAYPAAKRSLDIALSSIGLLLLAPLLLLVAAAVRLQDGGPAFYSHTRVGRRGRRFQMHKFRSMCVNADDQRSTLQATSGQSDETRFKLVQDPRTTRVGRFLRRTSIDELPQLWNVLRGDMSLVGPRPPLETEVALYGIRTWSRLDVRPGITCTWQISGRSDIPFDGQVDLDLAYINQRSFTRDLRILLGTVPAVLAGRGAY